jgi:hypothetical protein
MLQILPGTNAVRKISFGPLSCFLVTFPPLPRRADLDPPALLVQRLSLLAPFTFPFHYFISPLARTCICASTACIRLHVTCLGWPVLGPQFIISVGLFYCHWATLPVCAYAAVLDPALSSRCLPV